MDNHRPGSSWRPLIAALVATSWPRWRWCGPAPALAHDSIDAVDIDLTVNTDGSIRIVEEREFNFDGSFNGVYWDIATSAPAETSSEVSPWVSDLSVEGPQPELGHVQRGVQRRPRHLRGQRLLLVHARQDQRPTRTSVPACASPTP